MVEAMTLEEHKKEHVDFHKALDEMVADFINIRSAENRPYLPSQITLLYFMQWSKEQSDNPKEIV